VSKSPLCHASVAQWCKAADKKSYSVERNERCGWLVGDTAMKTVELLNAKLDGSFKPVFLAPAKVTKCMSCHEKGGRVENIRGKMDCGACHFSLGTAHP
jgi:hypothetical protein